MMRIDPDERLNILIDQAPVGITATECGVVVYCNRAAAAMYGYENAGDLVGKNVSELIHPDDIQGLRDLAARIWEGTPMERPMCFRAVRPDGSVAAIEGFGFRFRFNNKDRILSFHSDITERRVMEEELRRSSERYRVLVENAEEAIAVAQDGKLRYVNPAGSRMSGYTSEELLSRPFVELIHPDDRSMVVERHIARLEGLKPVPRYAFRMLTKDGGIRWLEITAALIEWDGRPATLELFTDITERRRAEEELRKANSILSTLVQAIPDIVFFKDAEGRNLEVNKAYEELTGLKRNELIGRTDRDILPEALASQCMRSDNEAIRHGGSIKFEESSRTEQGDEIFFETIKAPVFNEGGILTGLVGVSRDITERKRADRELLASKARLQTVVSAAKDGVVMVDGNGEISLWNEAAERMFGYPALEAIGRDLHRLIAPERFFESYEKGLQGFQSTGTGAAIGKTLELSAVRRNGEEFPVELSLSPVRIGDAWHAVGIVRDITDRKKAEEERIAMERRVLQAQKLESLGIMAGGIAHDFNNLLAVMLGNLDLAQMSLNGESPALEHILETEKAARRAADLTRQILTYSGKERFRMEEVNLSGIIRDMDDLITASAAHTASIRKALSEDLPPIQADPDQIRQVVMNIVINASEALCDKPGSIIISTGFMDCDESLLNQSRAQKKPAAGRFVYLKVEDTGSGMDEETLARVFDPFYTTRFLGRGLGLPAVLGIINGHRGAVIMDSTPGMGTTVLILFPEAGSVSTVKKEPDGSRHMPRAGQTAMKGTIMVVDDDDMVRDTCSALLRHLGYAVIAAEGGREAIRLYAEHNETISCIILDLTMPDLDGASTYAELKGIDPGVRVILSSGYSRQEATRHLPAGDLAGYIQKPYQLRALNDLLEQVMSS